MNSFKSNLEKFELSQGLTDEDMLDLSHLDSAHLDCLKQTNGPQSVAIRFAINCSIDYTSLYSDEGFRIVDVQELYNSCPELLQKIACVQIARKMIKKFKSSIAICGILAETPGCSDKLYNLFVEGECQEPLNNVDLDMLESIFETEFPSERFDYFLAKIVYKKIANYNYLQIKEFYNVGYKKLGSMIGVSNSQASNWGGFYCVDIASEHQRKICEIFNLDIREFQSNPISLDRLSENKVQLSDSTEIVSEDTQQESNRRTNSKNESERISRTSKADSITGEGIDDAIALKMFEALSEKDQSSIKKLVLEKFLASDFTK